MSCRRPGVTYEIVCVLCENIGTKAVYFSESGKNAFSRGKKHLDDYKSGLSSHCMTIHQRVHHPDVPLSSSNFRMIPVKAFGTALDRQVSEALNINNANVDILMNSGSEWRSRSLPRASVSRQ